MTPYTVGLEHAFSWGSISRNDLSNGVSPSSNLSRQCGVPEMESRVENFNEVGPEEINWSRFGERVPQRLFPQVHPHTTVTKDPSSAFRFEY